MPSAALAERYVDRRLTIHDRCHRAVLVSRAGDVETAVWLELALIDVAPNSDGTADVCMPEGLARARGLL